MWIVVLCGFFESQEFERFQGIHQTLKLRKISKTPAKKLVKFPAHIRKRTSVFVCVYM